jgi:hypothetical protein
MIWVMVGSLIVAALSVAFAIRCYRELWKWARQCQYARIVVAHKNRVRLNAPLVEWLLWCNQLDKDKDANGRMVYSLGGTSVSIIKKTGVPTGRLRRMVKSTRPARVATGSAPQVREGTWSARDETPKQ